MKIAVITGESRGLGEALARLFLKERISVIGISRTNNQKLSTLAKENKVHYLHYDGDFSQHDDIKRVIENVGQTFDKFTPQTIYLVNNAAVVNPVNQASQINHHELKYHMQVNLLAPMMLTNALLQMANRLSAKLIGVTVTSGASQRPVYGWSAYSSSKAGITMYTQAIALEQETLGSGHKFIVFNPGIMDTHMQMDIRKHSKEEFIDIERFKAYKSDNMLNSSDDIAEKLYSILQKGSSIKNGYIY